MKKKWTNAYHCKNIFEYLQQNSTNIAFNQGNRIKGTPEKKKFGIAHRLVLIAAPTFNDFLYCVLLG